MIQLERLRAMAREAIDQYHSALRSGEEPSYPQWADDILVVCDEAEANMLWRNATKLLFGGKTIRAYRSA